MAWFAEISRPAPHTDDARPGHAGAGYHRPPDDGGEAPYLPGDEGGAPPGGLTPVRASGAARRRRRRPARRSGRRVKALGAAAAVTVAGGAVGGWMLMAGPGRDAANRPVQAQGPPPLTGAQRKAAEADRLEELRRRASRAARKDDSRPRLFAKGTPLVTKRPETHKPDLGGPTPVGEAQRIARAMLPDYGWSPSSQFGCLVNLWNKESGWNTHASNPSGAYGIPQALPGSKMASAGPDWQDNARTQIKWGLGYIRDRYGTPCAAWQHSESTGWY